MSAPILTISILAAAFSACMLVVLALNVVVQRRKFQVGLGEGTEKQKALQRAVRAHANFAENTSVFLVLLALLEAANASNTWLTACAVLFFFGRLSHAFSLLYAEEKFNTIRFRQIGMISGFISLISLAIHGVLLTL